MSKEEDIKFLKIQTCILKVNIHCDGCKKKVKKLLHKVDGVYTTSIDAEQGKVTVSGNVDPATLIKKLAKAGKHAELLAPKGGGNNNIGNQVQKPQPQGGKGQQKDNGKAQKAGNGGGGAGGGGKDHKGQHPHPQPTPQQQLLLQQQLQQLQQMKGAKDLQLPQLKEFNFPPYKDPKSVNAAFPPGGCDDYDDDDDFDDDFDDDEMDEFDCFDADFDDDFKNLKIKPPVAAPNGNAMNDKKGGSGDVGGGKKAGGVPVQNKGMCNSYEPKNGNGGNGKKGGGGGGNPNQGGGGGGSATKNNGGGGAGGGGKNGGGAGPQDGKNVANSKKGAPNGSGNASGQAGNCNTNGNIMNPANGANKGPMKSVVGVGGPPMANPGMMRQGFPGMGMGHQMGNMHAPMGQMGNIPTAAAAAQGLPSGGPPPGYYQGGMVAPPPEVIAAANANPYQQQYIAAMMQQQQQQQQQQRMMMMNAQDRAFQPMMGYARPPLPMYYNMPPPPPAATPHHHSDPYTTFFSDENTSGSCSIM
ncbi:hypothetical protein OPV22_030836 [Ensete ventricosum]|uniref:HMA domain-containing protein n=1 Tax=Ensete ventricosum TaxID=4639 RepID=A0AAV8PL38_ENSVE|nr:hypothetical protein OPV22_030836 [Ensete ventricosum]